MNNLQSTLCPKSSKIQPTNLLGVMLPMNTQIFFERDNNFGKDIQCIQNE